jgi:hypothetical protein
MDRAELGRRLMQKFWSWWDQSSTWHRPMKIIEIHTPEEIAAEVEVLRADHEEVARLVNLGVLRYVCFEDDLKTEAYNRLTEKKLMRR